MNNINAFVRPSHMYNMINCLQNMIKHCSSYFLLNIINYVILRQFQKKSTLVTCQMSYSFQNSSDKLPLYVRKVLVFSKIVSNIFIRLGFFSILESFICIYNIFYFVMHYIVYFLYYVKSTELYWIFGI